MELTVANIVRAAKQREIDELKRLALKAELAGYIGHLIDALQSERGASSIYLASAGARFSATRSAFIATAQSIEGILRTNIATQLQQPNFGNAKILSLMGWALLGLDALPELRAQIDEHKLTAYTAVAAFSRLIAGLIALIFELADAAIHPNISRLLVAYFNFVQGKEFAGQERAVGALCFASGQCDSQHQQRVLHLIEAQERHFQIFLEFTDNPISAQWQQLQVAPCIAQLERLRRVLSTTKPSAQLNANYSDIWFECCSGRIAQMWLLQCSLTQTLQQCCSTLIADAEHDQFNAEGLLQSLREHPPAPTDSVDRFFDSTIPLDHALAFVPNEGLRARSAASMMEMLQVQSERLARMEAELESARRALNERKTIERAKGVLMARLEISEEYAYKMLRKTAMDQNRRLVDVAAATLSLPGFIVSPSSEDKS